MPDGIIAELNIIEIDFNTTLFCIIYMHYFQKNIPDNRTELPGSL